MKILFQRNFYTDDVSPLLKLAIPLMFSGIIESSIGFFSTLFLAHLGHQELAAGALVTWVFGTLMVILWGILTSISVLVAQKHGAKNNKGVSYILRDGLLLGIFLVVPTFLLLWYLSPIFLWLGQNPAIVSLAQSYLHALAWGLLPDFIMLGLLQFMIGLGHSKISMIIILIWVCIAIFCNYILIFGKFGMPRFNIAGIGWGMTLSYWSIAIVLVIYFLIHKVYKSYLFNMLTLNPPFCFKELLNIGVPVGFMYCVEVGFFLVLTLLMGSLGNEFIVANQIVLQYLGLVIAVIFAIAQAVSVRMGHKLGAKEFHSAETTSYAGIYIAVIFMGIISLSYWLIPEKLIAIDLNIHDPKIVAVIHYTKQFFAVCAIFQLLESIRIVLFGSLRALKDTRFTLLMSVISFWLIALPIGYLLSKSLLGSVGLWCGMVIGSSFSVILLSYRFSAKIKEYQN